MQYFKFAIVPVLAALVATGRRNACIGAAVILPREPLAPGHYKVALKEADTLYQWAFHGCGAACSRAVGNSLAGS